MQSTNANTRDVRNWPPQIHLNFNVSEKHHVNGQRDITAPLSPFTPSCLPVCTTKNAYEFQFRISQH